MIWSTHHYSINRGVIYDVLVIRRRLALTAPFFDLTQAVCPGFGLHVADPKGLHILAASNAKMSPNLLPDTHVS